MDDTGLRRVADDFRHSNVKVLAYPFIIGIATMIFGFDQGLTDGILTMQL